MTDSVEPSAPAHATTLEDTYETLPDRRKGCACIASAALALLLLVSVVVGGGLYYLSLVGGDGRGEGEVPFTVREGESVSQVAQRLESDGVIKSSTAFKLHLRLKGIDPVVQAGDYEMRRGMGADAVLDVFSKGPIQRYRTLTLVPGLTVDQQGDEVRKQLGMSKERFLSSLKAQVSELVFADLASPEGLCFPETYRIEEKMTEEDVARTCLVQFDTTLGSIDKSGLGRLGVTEYQAVIVASLVEREARLPEERPLIAGVIYNRLKEGMPLQIDATVLYALGGHKEQVLYRDLEVDSPYNTYRYRGLPPTPIAAPGKSSLAAAFDPTPSNYKFYVLTETDGRHAFSETLAEHERQRADAQRRGVIG